MKPGDPLHPVTEWNLTCSPKHDLVALELFVLSECQAQPSREQKIYGLTRSQARLLASAIQSQLFRLESGGSPDSLSE
jgi:hypothetical protein